MDLKLNSIKARFLGSYALLILLIVVQLPVIYLFVGEMSRNFAQVEMAGELRKRAIEINYILNRHILNGEEELEAVFQAQKAEFGDLIESLRRGDDDVPAIEDPAALVMLDAVEENWKAMRAALDHAMSSGDAMNATMVELEDTTFPMVEKLDGLVKAFVSLKDASYARNIDLAGSLKTKVVSLSYLMERYARTNYDLDHIREGIGAAISDVEEVLGGLKSGSAPLGLKAAGGRDFRSGLSEIEVLWKKRKELVAVGIEKKGVFALKVDELSNRHTPQVVAACEALSAAVAANARGGALNGIAVMAATIIVSTSLGVFFMWATNKHLIKPLVRIKESVEGFAGGDLTRRAGISIRFLGREIKDEIVSLGESVDSMAERVSGVIGSIAESSGHLAAASEQLSASSSRISDGAGRQSTQTAQVATAMEEMNATVIEVARNSQQVSESARSAQEIALDGGRIVEQAIVAMREVSDSTSVTAETIKRLGGSSQEIGTIVSVINDIADQTNLLALNAAIEAARAGDQGRGFAVVADEVRKLAERTTSATKEISGMISAIQSETGKAVEAMSDGTRKVENGVKLANMAGDALKQIVTGVEIVTERISHIATSAEEQSTTTDEIARNMDSIADVAKSNVRTIGEMANATDEMARLADELKGLVSEFRARGRTAAGNHGAGPSGGRLKLAVNA